MALTPGTRFGHYDVIALIGEGGMGQVYRATDTKLKREVAVKLLLKAALANPPGRETAPASTIVRWKSE